MCWTSNLRLSRLVYLSCSAVHCFAIGSSSHEEVASNIGEWHWQKRDWKVSSDSAKDSEQTSLTSFDLEWQWHLQKRDWKVSSDITWRDDLLWSHGAIFNIVSVDMSWPFECIEQLKVKQCRKPASTGWKPWKTISETPSWSQRDPWLRVRCPLQGQRYEQRPLLLSCYNSVFPADCALASTRIKGPKLTKVITLTCMKKVLRRFN